MALALTDWSQHPELHTYKAWHATCRQPQQWNLTAEENWISGFIDRSHSRLAADALFTMSAKETSSPDRAPLHTKPITSARRSLQQGSQTYQATVTFTLSFTSQPASSQSSVAQDVSDALKQVAAPLDTITTIVPVASSTALALNVSILFPPGNTVSATPSQATLAAVTLTSALTSNPAQALPSLFAKLGAFQVQSTSISNALVPQGSPSSTQRASPLTGPAPPSAPATLSSPFPAAGVHSPLPATSNPTQTRAASQPPPPPEAGLPTQVTICSAISIKHSDNKCYEPMQ